MILAHLYAVQQLLYVATLVHTLRVAAESTHLCCHLCKRLPASHCSEGNSSAKISTQSSHLQSTVYLLVEHTMSLEELPTDILSKILQLLTTTEKTRLSVLSHGLRDAIKASWTSVTLHCSCEKDIFNQMYWVNSISDCRPQTLQVLQWQSTPTRTAPATSRSSSVLFYPAHIGRAKPSLYCLLSPAAQLQASCSLSFSHTLFALSLT